MPELAYDLYGDTFVEVPTRAEEEAEQDRIDRLGRGFMPLFIEEWVKTMYDAAADSFFISWDLASDAGDYTATKEYIKGDFRIIDESTKFRPSMFKYDYLPDTRPHWQQLNARGKHWMKG